MIKKAQLSECGMYRYSLERQWGDNPANYVLWVMLNPSTADATTDDPTIKRCIKFSQYWGHDRLVVANLYPLRTPYPKDCKPFAQWDQHGPDWQSRDRIHHVNLPILLDLAASASQVIVAWGTNAGDWDVGYVEHVVEELEGAAGWDGKPGVLYCIGMTKNRSPKHPLARGKHRVPDHARPIEWTPLVPSRGWNL